MDADLKKTLTVNAIICAVILAVGLGYFFYSRRDPGTAPTKKQEPTYSANQDDYVTPRKIFPYNLESAKKELVDKPIWVKAGNSITYYAYNAATHTVDFKKKIGLLAPLAQLQGEDVGLQRGAITLKES